MQIWVDWNQDGDFGDAGEFFAMSGGPETFTGTITPPGGASLGDIRMRVRIKWTGTLDPCGDTTYGEVEDYTINVTGSDSGEIYGSKFHDMNGNGIQDEGEPRLQGWKIYIDENENGVWDNGEQYGLTDANGDYAFTELAPGSYTVAEVNQPEWQQTFPGGDGTHLVSLSYNEVVEDIDFGNRFPPGYGGGSGTAEDPYLIYTAAQMSAIGATPSDQEKHFKLMADIDLSYYTGTQFNIIGSEGNPFMGVFDGKGHTISNFTYLSEGTDYIGVFGVVNGHNAEIKDLGLLEPNLSGGDVYLLDGLVSWWEFDEGSGTIAYDSYDENHGTLVNVPVWTTGKTGGALEFDGVDDYIALPDNNPIWLPQYDFTLSAWVYFSTDPSSESEFILDLNHASSDFSPNELGYSITRRNESGKFHFSMTTTTNPDEVLDSLAVLDKNTWYHVVAVRDGTSQAIYINGQLDNSRTCSPDTIDFVGGYDDDKVSIGRFSRNGVSSDFHLDGKIDDVAIYNCALSAEEIELAYQQGLENFVGSLAGWLKHGSISGCYADGGSVSGFKYVGGLAGRNSGSITNCYATSSAEGYDEVGGLVGENSNGGISNCYSTGKVVADSNVGGLVGINSGGTVTNSFWDVQTSDCALSDGGVGLTTAVMQMAIVFTSAGWDFVGESDNGVQDIWRMCIDGINYPKLTWEFYPLGDFLCPDGVDFIDYSYFANHWGNINCGDVNDCNGVDLDFSDSVDANDLGIFTNYWLLGK
ncbi:LamG-like jellyroll fold domain-containing protein [Planctomycetota bacterium]